jgi:glycosyltransferase involved in cell wall biosynthesis
MKEALVVHPRFLVFGGGELLSLYTMKALQESGYHVSLVSDTFDPEQAQRIYGLGKTMASCDHIQIPPFKGVGHHGLAFQRMMYASKNRDLIKKNRAEMVFSTQSSLFSSPRKKCFHFLYDIVDLFAYPPITGVITPIIGHYDYRPWYQVYYWLLKQIRVAILGPNHTASWFFALAENVLADLKARGYPNSSMLYPPCRLDFLPKPKQPWIIQVTRLVPQKRLEWFFQVARMLAQFRFILVGRDSPTLRSLVPHYVENLMGKKPENVDYIEAPIKQVPELLEKSKIYLYTGEEPGIGIALVEAIGAGCIPLAPVNGGGGEVVRATTGFVYRNPKEAAEIIQEVMEDHYPLSPEMIREKAKPFSPEVFMSKIQNLVS